MFKHYLKSMTVMLTLMLGMTMTVSAAYVTSLTSGKYYRIFSAYSELADKVVMFADASGMQYKVYDEGYDAMDGSMVFLATANGTFHGYDAYNLKAIGNDLYVGKAAVQWCSRGYWGDESSNTDFYIASSASAWNQCIIPMGTGGHGDAMFTDQFLIQPAHDTGSTVQQCVSLNGTAATTGFLRMNAWSDDASAPYENSIRAWSFEEVDQSTVEQILDAQDPLKNALNNLADKYESLQGGTAPGEYVKANVDAFKALYEDYLGQSAAGGLTAAQKQAMAEELTAAYDKAVSEKNTFADGTYRIVSAAKTDAKYALYVAEDGALKWKAYDEANAKQFVFDVKNLGTTYTFDGQPHEQFSLQNLATSLYVSSGNMEQNSAGMGVDGTTEENAYPVCFTYSSAVPQIIMQPMRQNKSGVSQCIAINDVNATEGIIRQTSWLNYNADGTAACWIFEPVEYVEGPATEIAEGWYAIVSAGKGSGYSGGPYDDENMYALYNADGIVKWKAYDKDDYTEYYYFTSDGDGSWFAKSLADETYINRGTGSYSCNITTSAEATTAQTFEAVADQEGKWTAKFKDNPYVYALNAGHNGAAGKTEGTLNIWGTGNEAANNYKMNLWYLYPVSTAQIEAGKEQMVAGLGDLIAEIEAAGIEAGEAPGDYVVANVDALNAALAEAEAALDGTADAKLAAISALKAAYNKATSEFNPVVDGYYYLVNGSKAYEETFGAPAAMYAVTGQTHSGTGKHIVRFEKFDENNANFIFKLTQKEGVVDGFDAQSVYTNYYLDTGAGDNWYGELTTISETADNAQLFRQYKPGLFWVADETDTDVSRVIRPAEQNATVYGWTTISDNITEDKQWYNAWKLIPVAEDKVNEIVEAQKTADADKAEAIAQLTQFVTDNAAAIAEVTAEDAAITPSTKAEVQETVETITAAAARWSYDIITPAAEIRQMLEDAEDLLVKALEELNPEPRYWQVAAEPSAPEAGKSYIIKNAYSPLYLFAGEEKGVNSPAVVEDNFVYAPEYVWTLEEAGSLSEEKWEKKDALLTDASQITSNNTQSGFPTGNLLRPESDGYGLNQYIWHSSWDAPLPAGTDTYLQTTFANAEQHIIFTMISSEWNSTYDTPDIVDIYATNTPDDETSWKLITTLSDMIAIKNAHPTFYTSPHIDLGAAYTAVRFVVKQTTMKDYPARYDSNRNPYVSLGRFQVYSAENNGTTNTSFALKSFSENAYWKYVDYASQTWDATTPYDGYDWYDYKGMNAEFGSVEEAQAFTILPAAAGDGIDGVGTEDVFDGSYVVTATEPFLNKLFKLDTQRGTNAALAPWMDSPAWLFYEATRGTDFSKEKELALAYYDFTSEYVGTAPGLYNSDNVANYNTAKAALEAVDASDVAAMRAAIEDLADAYELALEPNPVVDGYYFIVSDNANIAANGKETKALYINTDKSQVWWAKLDQTDLKFVFRITEDGDNWRVQGVESGLFTGEGFYPDVVSATLDYTYPVTFTAEGEGSFLITANGKRWCPQGNPDGKSDGPNGVWGWNVDGPHGEASFTLRPIDEADLELMVNNALIDVLAEYKDKTFEAKDQPGYAKPENVEAFNDAYATANGLGIASDLDDKIEAVSNLNIAYVKANTEVVPIEDGGYYFMVNKWAGYADKYGVPAAMYAVPGQSTSDTGKHIVRFDKFDETNANYIFKMTQKEGVANGFYAQSVYTDYYLNTGNGDSWYGELTTISEEPENAQIFTPYAVTGQFFVSDETDTRVSRVIRTSGVQNGTVYGWTTTGDNITDENKWYNAWELIPVAADKVDELVAATKTFDEERGAALDDAVAAADEAAADTTALLADDSKVSEAGKKAIRDAYAALEAAKKAKSYDILTTAEEYTALKDDILAAIAAAKEEPSAVTDYWQIADEPSMDFEPGKTYVLKNAYNDKYLSTDGGTVGQVNEIENFEIFSVEAAGEGTYYLQSLTAEEGQNYFQYNDYASQTWDGGVPYDGYDWYDYAGFNGEFGAAETAQEFTILRAVEAGEEDANNTPGSGKAVKEGSYIFTAKDQVMGKWYKLGVQGTNAALEPYNEDVAWYFYEATPVEDASGALDKAIAQYGDKQMQGGDAPGFYAADAVAEYNEAVQEAKDAVDSGDDAAKRAAVAALKEAGKKEYATNPIVDGETYFIVSAGYGPGYYTSATPPTEDQWYDDREAYAMYNADGAVKWGQYDDTMTRYAYTFTQDADGNWEVKNVADNSYIGRCVNNEGADAEYSGKVSTTEGVTYKQQFQFISEGKFFMTFVGERGLVTAYALTNSHNGSKNGEAEPGNIGNWGTASEAAKFGVNVWYLIPVSDEMKEKLTAVDGIAAGGEGFGVQSADGGISFTADKAQTLRVVSASGAVVALQKVEAGETVSIQLVPGIYIVNGKKIAVK